MFYHGKFPLVKLISYGKFPLVKLISYGKFPLVKCHFLWKISSGKMPSGNNISLFPLKCIFKLYISANTQILRYQVKPMFFHGKFPQVKYHFSWQISTGKMPFSNNVSLFLTFTNLIPNIWFWNTCDQCHCLGGKNKANSP